MKHDIDSHLRRALHARVENVRPGECRLMRIKREIRTRKEEKNMRFTTRRIIAIAAMVCLICTGCLAAARYTLYESHSLETVEGYEAVSALAEKAIPNAKHVQRFENGYAFVRGGTYESSASDSDEKHIGLTLGYQNAENRNLALYIDAEIGSAQPGYRCDACKFVPPDYVPTEEDRAQEAAGELFISYGSEKVELNQMESYSWLDGGLHYRLIAFDCNFGEAEMAAMAAQITA